MIGAAELDRLTLDSWVVANTLAHRFFLLLMPSLFSAESPELSLLHFLFYVKSGTSIESLMTTTRGAQESRVVGGTHLISERRPDALGESVRLNAVVRTIRQDGSVVVVEHEGGSLAAEYVIVAVPQTLAGRLRYDPPLPALRHGLTQQMPAGAAIKFQVGYDRPFWREDGLSGTVLSFDDAFNVVLDNSPSDGSCGVLVGFLEGRHARATSPMIEVERRGVVISDLVKYFGPKAAEPFDIVEQDWAAEEFTRGCYCGRLGAGAWTQYGKTLAAPVGRIHWAGAETSFVKNGCMDGSILPSPLPRRQAVSAPTGGIFRDLSGHRGLSRQEGSGLLTGEKQRNRSRPHEVLRSLRIEIRAILWAGFPLPLSAAASWVTCCSASKTTARRMGLGPIDKDFTPCPQLLGRLWPDGSRLSTSIRASCHQCEIWSAGTCPACGRRRGPRARGRRSG